MAERAARAYHTPIRPERKEKNGLSLEKLIRFSVKSGSIVAIFQPSRFATRRVRRTTCMLIATRRLMRGDDDDFDYYPYPIVRREPVAADVAPPTGKRTIGSGSRQNVRCFFFHIIC